MDAFTIIFSFAIGILVGIVIGFVCFVETPQPRDPKGRFVKRNW